MSLINQSRLCIKKRNDSIKLRRHPKTLLFLSNCYDFMWFYTQYHVILSFEILCLTKVLCGIWDIFPWQIIWDLSKKFQLRRNIHSHKKIGKSTKVTQVVYLYAKISTLMIEKTQNSSRKNEKNSTLMIENRKKTIRMIEKFPKLFQKRQFFTHFSKCINRFFVFNKPKQIMH